jgi:N6-L-threonylcarbamoyladenine synthase
VENLKGAELPVDDLAASFQDAVNRVLFRKTIAVARAKGVSKVVLAGGVAANSDLRKRFESLADIEFYRPAPALCTDNAVMVAAAALL